jgi:isoleucyl-tRNA synthetase
VPDVMDVWFDAGVASWASLGYPRDRKLFKEMWPADFILEGPDQIRGWWNSLMITSMMTFGRAPFENVLFHGFVLDAHGTKMSKSLGNVIVPEDVVKKYGRDVLRFYFLSGAPWDDYFFKWEDVEELAKSFVVLRNTFNFVKTYVNSAGKPRNLKKEDRWLLSRLSSLVQNSTEYCQTFNGHRAAKEILDFILNDFSRWYIKLIRDRTWPTYTGKDKQAAFYTLFTAVETLARLLAPFTPFLAEDVYQTIVKPLHGKMESIHMHDWPKTNKKLIDKNLERNMAVVKEIVEASLAARQKASIKLRWPIKRIVIVSKNKFVTSAAKQLKDVLLQMCNCKSVEILVKSPHGEFSFASFNLGTVFINKKMDKKLLEEAMVREVIREIQSIRKINKFNVKQNIALTVKSDDDSEKILSQYKDVIKKEVGASKVSIGDFKGKYKGSVEFEDKKIEIAFN